MKLLGQINRHLDRIVVEAAMFVSYPVLFSQQPSQVTHAFGVHNLSQLADIIQLICRLDMVFVLPSMTGDSYDNRII
jgi:hypothetical protein